MSEERSAILSILETTDLILDSRDEKCAPLIAAARELHREGKIDMAEDPVRNLLAMRLK